MNRSELSSASLTAADSQRWPPLSRALWIFIIASTLAMTGNFMQRVALGWSVWDATHATTWLGAAALAGLLPTLAITIPAGALIDRYSPTTCFWMSQAMSCLVSFLLTALAASGHLTIAGLFVGIVLLGACEGFVGPARFACMTQLTPRDSYTRATVFFSIAGNTAFFAGPMIAGPLISRLGVGAAYLATGIMTVPIIIVSMATAPVKARSTEVSEESMVKQVSDGFAYAAHNANVLRMLLAFAALAVTARGVVELAPSIAATTLGGGVQTLSLLTSSIGIGALLAGLGMSRWGGWPERTSIIVTLAGAVVALVGYGTSANMMFALLSAVLLGVMLGVNNIAVSSAIQLHTEPSYRGRVNSIYTMIFRGGPAVGAAIFGWLAQVTSIRWSAAVATAVLGLLMIGIVRGASRYES